MPLNVHRLRSRLSKTGAHDHKRSGRPVSGEAQDTAGSPSHMASSLADRSGGGRVCRGQGVSAAVAALHHARREARFPGQHRSTSMVDVGLLGADRHTVSAKASPLGPPCWLLLGQVGAAVVMDVGFCAAPASSSLGVQGVLFAVIEELL